MFRLTSILGLVSLVSCTSVDSENILTSGMYASIVATADGDGDTGVNATLYLGNPLNLDFIELGPDDELWAHSQGMDKRMSEFELLGLVSYGASFDFDAEGTEFLVEFVRMVDEGAPESRATLPARFDILTAGGATLSRSEDLVIDWDPSGTDDLMQWEAQGNCIKRATGTISGDPGTATIAGGTLQKRMGDMVEDSCQVTLTLERSREGLLDPAYGEGGTIRGRQARTLTLTSQP